MDWTTYAVIFICLFAFAWLFYRFGKVTGEARTVREFDEVILRIRKLSWSRNYAGLDVFLHDLTEDTPLSMYRLAKNSRFDKDAAGINREDNDDEVE